MKNTKPSWYKQAGKEPFKRNQFNENLAAKVRSRIGSKGRRGFHLSWLLSGAVAAVVGSIILMSSVFSGGASDLVPSISPAVNPPTGKTVDENSEEIRMIDKKNGWAFGTRIKRTSDGGKTWVDRTPEGVDSSSVLPFPLDEQHAWILVRPNSLETPPMQSTNWLLYRTTDGGKSWTPSSIPAKEIWNVPTVNTVSNLHFIDEKTGFFYFVSDPAGGPVKTAFYQTTDGGQTWKYLNKIVPDGVLNSTPSGMSFSDHLNGFITFYNSDDLQPEVYRTSDGGASWKRLQVDLPEQIKNAVFNAEHPPIFFGKEKKEGVLSISYTTRNNEKTGVVWFTTENGGFTWSAVTYKDSAPIVKTRDGSAPQGFRSHASSDLKHFWMVDAESGTLYGSLDSGRQWVILYTSAQLQNVSVLKFIDEKIGWASGRGFFLQTEDGGKSWKKLGE